MPAMSLVLPVLGLVGGLVLLTRAADHFVAGAARLAVHWRLSSVVVGAVVIGFGTSTPELLVSGLAGLEGSIDIAIANIVGSNTANVLLVMGAAALVSPIVVRSPVVRREVPLSLLAVTVFALVVQNGVRPFEAVVLAVLLVITLTIVVATARRGDADMTQEVEEFLADGPPSVSREAVRTVVGLTLTLAGAQVLVWSAVSLAGRLGLSEGFIGLTIVAVGTSLPELATSLQAARRGETDLIVGNLLGSNVFNALAVGATAVAAGAGQVASASVTGRGVVLMLGAAVLATVAMLTGRRVTRTEGALLVSAYLATVLLVAG